MHEPFNLARQLTTLDHISRGRAGWNMVTSFSLAEARNFAERAVALRSGPCPRQRHIDVFKGLEESWDDDALVRDRQAASSSTARACGS